MPRLPIDPDEAEAIADFLGAKPWRGDVAGDARKGKSLFEQNGCATCHGQASERITARATILAPHLGWAKSRLGFDQLVGWIRHPRQQKADTMMPDFGFTQEEATDLAAYVVTIAPPRSPKWEEPELRKIHRKVEFSEVHALLRDRCLHCHNEPGRDAMGGPGYGGGWGFEGKSLSLLTYPDVVHGGRDADGVRSPFERVGAQGRPRIVEHLVARHREVAGEPTDIVGMPLGQPPVEWKAIETLNAWIRQGKRPPKAVSHPASSEK